MAAVAEQTSRHRVEAAGPEFHPENKTRLKFEGVGDEAPSPEGQPLELDRCTGVGVGDPDDGVEVTSADNGVWETEGLGVRARRGRLTESDEMHLPRQMLDQLKEAAVVEGLCLVLLAQSTVADERTDEPLVVGGEEIRAEALQWAVTTSRVGELPDHGQRC